ncbi:uncharacterized protein B0H18DRAFT_1013014 [Fomitopsis serialis]|uniref:uncharacterized protein n=1 Tax=Fomitopsis serialis TaxID=139415 RepID=UPI0020086DE1|nr:uncharacterized protein B0H18DRAFT_1013014 [Neoantrodia serialis]KAH9924010.1 hypothetical protein B0H18DRAFT_1013014 [Neoantrodia serialis]
MAGLAHTAPAAVAAKNMWHALVQVRQLKVPHKRAFLFLQQLILKHGAHAYCKDTISVKEV